ncbi:GNAT family N-acetyltransferase [Parabacteroides sp.]
MEIMIRNVEENDLKTICNFPRDEQELYFMFPRANYPLTVEQLEYAIKMRFDASVILLDNEIAGFANFYEVKENHHCSIGNVIVNPHFRNHGVATSLVTSMENIGKEKYNISEIHLSCFDTNTKGLLLYTKLGYKPYEIEKWINKADQVSALIKLKKLL